MALQALGALLPPSRPFPSVALGMERITFVWFSSETHGSRKYVVARRYGVCRENSKVTVAGFFPNLAL